MIERDDVKNAARYQWPAILQCLAGLDERQTRNVHQPCPACGGKDRYRFDDDNGHGMYYCNHCGAGDGFSLLSKVNGWTFSQSLEAVASHLRITDSAMPEAERDAMRQQRERQQAEREQQDALKREKAATMAGLIWQQSQAGGHPYLTAKHIQAHGARVIDADKVRALGAWIDRDLHGSLLVIPARDGKRITTVELIDSAGKKHFLAGGRKRGSYYAMRGDAEGAICVCEGFATGASICTATGFAVAVAFDCHNLLPVCQTLRQLFPDRQIIVCADDDAHTDGNPGRRYAEAAARAVGGLVALPVFQGVAA